MIISLLIATAFFLAFSNGANDNFKGFATSYGSGLLSYRTALILSNVATLAGGIASVIIADGLIKQFSGRGLVDDALAASAAFSFAVAAGAGITVMLATRLGFPISTTHAIVGGLTGAGLVSSSSLQWDALGSGFMLPLLISPVLSAVVAFTLYGGAKLLLRGRATSSAAGSAAVAAQTELTEGSEQGSKPLNGMHVLSAVAICFARAVNDTPKLAAVMLGAGVLSSVSSALSATAAMVLGGFLLSRRVAETMSLKISDITPVQGTIANLITATLVLAASRFSLPVSTTHVSVGSIIGSGAAAGRLDLSTVRNVLLSWVVTLPLSAAIAAIAGYFVL
jgi:inorganic phosphate transporter, PiT family